MPVLAGRGPGDAGESFLAPTCGELQRYSFVLGERRRQPTEISCSAFAACAGEVLLQMKPLTPLVVLCSPLGQRCCFSSPGCGRAAWLHFKYLLDIWSHAHCLGSVLCDGYKSKGQGFFERLAYKKAVSDCTLLGTHTSGCTSGVPLRVTALRSFSLLEVRFILQNLQSTSAN